MSVCLSVGVITCAQCARRTLNATHTHTHYMNIAVGKIILYVTNVHPTGSCEIIIFRFWRNFFFQSLSGVTSASVCSSWLQGRQKKHIIIYINLYVRARIHCTIIKNNNYYSLSGHNMWALSAYVCVYGRDSRKWKKTRRVVVN